MQEHVEITEVSIEQKFILRQLLELYEYDFSEFNNCDLNDFGLYEYKYFDHYWTDENRHPYFVKVNGKYAGFVLINNHCYLQKNESAKSIAEFFIMRKYRRQGIGNDVARKIFDMFKGDWEVLQHGDNDGSKSFWRNVINKYTNGNYEILDIVTESWIGQGIIFNNSLKQFEEGTGIT